LKARTVKELFTEGVGRLSGIPDASLEARCLLLRAAAIDENVFHGHPESPVQARKKAFYDRLIRLRLEGHPLAYLTERKEFWSRTFRVGPGVLVPRPETELLVEIVLDVSCRGSESILDVGTGSGNIAITLALELPRAEITASDVSARALAIARRNASALGASRIRFLRSDLFNAFGEARPRFDIIVSNPPYISREDWRNLPPEIRDHEPRRALVGGEEGTEFAVRLIRESLPHLKTGGCFFMEIGAGQAPSLLSMFGAVWEKPEVYRDLAGIPRAVAARKKADSVPGIIS